MSDLRNKVKKTSLDFIYNIFASAILTGTMQVIVYPLLARWVSMAEYGTIVTAMGLINTVVGGFGTALNNARLIMNTDYSKAGVKGDFNRVLIWFAIISGVILYSLSFFYLKYSTIYSLTIALTSMFMVCRQYFVVDYRLILNFKKILFCNIFGAIGYVIGIGIFYCGLHIWPIVFMISELCSLVYIMKSSSVWKEPISKTPLFNQMIKRVGILLISVLFANMLTYFDRIFLYPTLGSESVSIYTVASFFGKSLSIVMTPISGVLLGYFAQEGVLIDRKKFLAFDVSIIIISIFFAVCAFIISPIVTSILYPEIFEKAEEYVAIANLAAIIAVSCNLLQPVILKFSPTYFQIVKEGIYAVVYFVLSFVMMKFYGLRGFCVAVLISNLTKYFVVSLMGLLSFKEEKGK